MTNLTRSRTLAIPIVALLATIGVAISVSGAGRNSLTPSRASLANQISQAQAHKFTYLRDAAQVKRFANNGWLVRLTGNADYRLSGVSFPYSRPEVRLFVERLSRQYRNACGERLVVTSATRPKNRQPPNASPWSVHPTGMALDLRVSRRRSCRAWLEDTLLYLEARNVLEVSRENSPPHYLLAVFPTPYRRYVEDRTSRTYRVARGDTLWSIAQRHGTTVRSLSQVNRLRDTVIRPGQVLTLPAGG